VIEKDVAGKNKDLEESSFFKAKDYTTLTI